MEMTRSILKHRSVPNWLWGEAVRHATYLINRVSTRSLQGETPYESLRKKKPNLSHLRIFGCVSFVRTNTVGRKKLDDRSKVLVHLGTEPGSKAYRLLDPTTKRVVVSRDVVFDEGKSWNWNEKEVEERGNSGSFMIGSKDQEEEERKIQSPHIHTQPDVPANIEEIEEDEEEHSNEEDEDNEDSNANMLRRSSRVRTKPAYLDEYILLADCEYERLLMTINDEP